MSFDKKFTYSSSSSSEIHIDISNEFYNHYEFKDLVKFQSGFFKKNHGLLNNVSQDMWYMCQKFYSPSTYFPKPGLLHRNGPKTYEILMEFDLVSYSNGTLNSLHLDEEYGAVVGAINHYLHSNVKEVFVYIRADKLKINHLYFSGGMELDGHPNQPLLRR